MSETQCDRKKLQNNNYGSKKVDKLSNVQKQSLATFAAMAAPNAMSNYQDRPPSPPHVSRAQRSPMKLVSVMFNRGTSHGENSGERVIDGHIFVKHTFKKATFCDFCQRLLLDFERQGLRCKTCKFNIHEICANNVGPCNGRPMFGTTGFMRQSGDAKQELPTEDAVDSVYQILQEGRVLRLGEVIDMTDRQSAADQEKSGSSDQEKSPSSSKEASAEASSPIKLVASPVHGRSASPRLRRQSFPNLSNTYVALYKYDTAQKEDLPLLPGDKINVIKDKDEVWWMGEANGRSGFFPAKFVSKIRSYEAVYTVNNSTTVKDIFGKSVSLKKNQVIFINPDWPIQKENQLYWRVGVKEGYISSDDITLA